MCLYARVHELHSFPIHPAVRAAIHYMVSLDSRSSYCVFTGLVSQTAFRSHMCISACTCAITVNVVRFTRLYTWHCVTTSTQAIHTQIQFSAAPKNSCIAYSLLHDPPTLPCAVSLSEHTAHLNVHPHGSGIPTPPVQV